MTVRELIEELSKHSPDLTAITDLHSEWSIVQGVHPVVGFDNGGYVSRAYRAADMPKAHGYVYVGVQETDPV